MIVKFLCQYFIFFKQANTLSRKKIVQITSSSRARLSDPMYMYRRASNVATCTEEVAIEQLGFIALSGPTVLIHA